MNCFPLKISLEIACESNAHPHTLKMQMRKLRELIHRRQFRCLLVKMCVRF